jgi:hypothetical protein
VVAEVVAEVLVAKPVVAVADTTKSLSHFRI